MPKIKNQTFYVHSDKNFNAFLNKALDLKYSILTSSLESISCVNIISWIFAKIFRRDELTEDSICKNLVEKFEDVKRSTPLHLLEFDQRTTAMGNLIELKKEFTNKQCINKIENLIDSLKLSTYTNSLKAETPGKRTYMPRPLTHHPVEKPFNPIQTANQPNRSITPTTPTSSKTQASKHTSSGKNVEGKRSQHSKSGATSKERTTFSSKNPTPFNLHSDDPNDPRINPKKEGKWIQGKFVPYK